MVQITLAQEPFQVAIRGRVNARSAKRRLLFAVALCVRAVALLTMVTVKESTGRRGLRLSREWIRALMVAGRNRVPMRGSTGQGRNRK